MDAVQAIDHFGIAGKPVCIHAAMRSFGARMEGLLEAFLDCGCTVMVPSFTDMFEAPPVAQWMPPQNGAGDYSYFYSKEYADVGVYTPACNKLTIEEMGAFVAMVLAEPDRERGNNALNSFAAVGKLAQTLVAEQTNEDVYAPLEKLYALDGYVLLMGVGLDSATAIHYAEQVAGRQPFVRWARGEQGTVGVRAGGCSEGFEKLAPMLKPYEQQVTVEKSLWRCYRIRDLVDTCVKAIREDPHITHCGDPDCSRCNDAVLGGPIL